jgi:hypothetical protein
MKVRRRVLRQAFASLLAVFLLLSLGLASAFAQGGTRGAITGTVKDPNGAAISGAQVEIINPGTGVSERTVTGDSEGRFSVSLLPVGTYRLVVTAPGFSKAEAPDVKVNVSETASVSITMKVGQITDAVNVQAAATEIQLTNATTGKTLTGQSIEGLPLSTRNFLTLLTLSSGTNGELTDAAALGRGAVSINVNGQRPVNNNYQLEGINANDFNLPTFDNVPLPNPQTIMEFKTQTSLYDASQGRNGGGNIQVALKSGTSQYHGDAFEFFRNNVLNANDFFFNSAGKERPVLRQNQFGGSFGGPVPLIKDFFFFANYQGTRASSGVSAGTNISTNIPVLPSDRSAANLQGIFFPTGLPAGVTHLDPVALAFLNLPGGKCPGFGGNFCIPTVSGVPGFTGTTLNLGRVTSSGVGTFEDDQYTITVDKQLTSKDKLGVRWFSSNNNTLQPFGTGSTLAFAKALPGENRFAKIGWTRVISSHMVNDARFGFNRFFFAQVPTEPLLLTDVGATRGNSSAIPAAFRISISGAGFSIGTGVNDDRGGAFNTFVWADDFSYTRGKHQFRMGGEIDRYQLNRFNRFATRGSVAFGSSGGLNGFQNFLLGRITSTQGSSGFSTFFFRATDAAAYVQDDWKFNDRLTLNLGLRWEGLSVAHEKNGFLSNFAGLGDDSSAPPFVVIHPADTKVVGTPGVSNCTLLHCFDKNNFAPRIGFAYDLFGNHKTVLRCGYGIYYQRTSNQPLLQTAGGLPFAQSFSDAFPNITLANPFPSSRPDSDFPLSTNPALPKLIGFNGTSGAPIFDAALGGFQFYPVRNFHSPYAQQFNLSVQHEFWKGWVAEVGYVGTRGVHLIGTGAPLNPSQVCTSASPCIIPSSVGGSVSVPAGTPFVTKNSDGSIAITGSTFDNRNARVPVRTLGLAESRLFAQDQAGQSTYNSLQTSLSHSFSRGLYFQAAYTWSKTLDNSSGSSFTDELNGLFGYGDLTNPKGQIGPADFDRTHRLALSYVWELPFAKMAGIEDRGFGKFVNGWSLQGVTIFQSGTPFVITDSSALTLQDLAGTNSTNFATLAPGKTLNDVLTHGSVNSRIDGFVNLDAFLPGGNCVNDQNQPVPQGSADCVGAAVGNVSRNRFRGPFQQNWDMSLIKTTKITERSSVEFRAEFFNIFNHPVFASPQAAGGSLGNYGFIDVAAGDTSILNTANDPRIIQFALKINW